MDKKPIQNLYNAVIKQWGSLNEKRMNPTEVAIGQTILKSILKFGSNIAQVIVLLYLLSSYFS